MLNRVAVVFALLITACGGATGQTAEVAVPSDGNGAIEAESTDVASQSTTTLASTTTTIPETTTTTTTTTTIPETTTLAPSLDPLISVAGTGDDIVDFVVPGDLPVALIVSHSGSSNFALTSFGAAGRIDLLVNTIGGYAGVVPANFLASETVSELEIRADGNWEIVAFQLAALPMMDGAFSDSGDFVLLHVPGATRLTATHNGPSNFSITAWGQPFTRDLLINEIGAYEGTVRMDPGTQLLVIRADGDWSLSSE